MPLYTSARTGSRYSNLRTRGFNGFAGTQETIQFWEATGFYLQDESIEDLIGSYSLTQKPLPERASESAREGDRISFSVSVIGETNSFSVDTSQNKGTLAIHCGDEYSWNFTVAYEGPACGGKIRATGVSGSITTYGSASISLPFGLDGPTAEEGTDYGTDTGERAYTTKDILGADGIPWSEWQ